MPRVAQKNRLVHRKPAPLPNSGPKRITAPPARPAAFHPLVVPESGFLRLCQIIGKPGITVEQARRNAARVALKRKAGLSSGLPVVPRDPVPGIIPMSASTWWAGVAAGRYPQPVKLGLRAVGWKASDIRELFDRIASTQAGCAK